jgi:hypothetical protein
MLKSLFILFLFAGAAFTSANLLVACAQNGSTAPSGAALPLRAGTMPGPALESRQSAFGGHTDCIEKRTMSDGFCITIDSSAQLTEDDTKFLRLKIRSFEKKFPKLFSNVLAKGFGNILIKPAAVGENGGAVLGDTDIDKKQFVFYADFFSVEKNNAALQGLGYSVTDIIILHELMHAYDDKNELVQNNLKILGWDPSGTSNIWATGDSVSKIKNELQPFLPKLGPWKIYVEARKRLQPFGYPSIYSILGGPTESFAELGAYIALDPSASNYIPPQTIKWYRENILQ